MGTVYVTNNCWDVAQGQTLRVVSRHGDPLEMGVAALEEHKAGDAGRWLVLPDGYGKTVLCLALDGQEPGICEAAIKGLDLEAARQVAMACSADWNLALAMAQKLGQAAYRPGEIPGRKAKM